MGSQYASTAVLALLPAVTIHRSGSSGSVNNVDSNFDGPPIEVAHLAVYGLFLFATLVQLVICLPAFSRPRARLPTIGVVTALAIQTIDYAVGIAVIVARFSKDYGGIRYINLIIPAALFSNWVNPAILAAVALVLRDRYRIIQMSPSGILVGFACATCVLLVIMVTLSAAKSAVDGMRIMEQNLRPIPADEMNRWIQMSNNILYTYVAFYVSATLILAVSAFIVKTCTKKDTITSLTIFAIIPLLLLHALARIILTVVGTQPPALDRTDYSNFEATCAVNFASTLVYGVLLLAVTTVIVFLLSQPFLWGAKRPSRAMDGVRPARGAPPPTFFLEGVSPARFLKQSSYLPEPQSPTPRQQKYIYPQQNYPMHIFTPQKPRQFEERIRFSSHPYSAAQV